MPLINFWPWPPPSVGVQPLYHGYRNAQPVPGQNLSALAGYVNGLSAQRRKVFFTHSILPTEAFNSATTDTTTWRFRFHTGVAPAVVRCRMAFIPSNVDIATAPDPHAYWATTPDGGGATNQADLPITARDARAPSAMDPDDIIVMEQTWTDISANTAHQAELHVVDRVLPISCAVWEEPIVAAATGSNGLIDLSKIGERRPIYDAQANAVHTALRNLHRRQGTHFHSWTQKAATGATVTGATWTNVWSAGTGGPAAGSYGAYLRPRYSGTYESYDAVADTEVIKVAYYAYLFTDAAGQAEFRFNDSVGAMTALTTTSTTGAWVTGTADWTIDSSGADFKIDPEFRNSTAGKVTTCRAFGLFSYEA